MIKPMDPIIIDVEASGFGRGSYPIEVGVAMPDGRNYCTIIRPERDWTHWDKTAETLHGISREILVEHGRSPLEVARQLNVWLAGEVVYSDAWSHDSSWLAQLFERAGISQHFKLQALRELMTDQQLACWNEVKQEVIKELGYRRHRASQDALILHHTYVRSAAKTGGITRTTRLTRQL